MSPKTTRGSLNFVLQYGKGFERIRIMILSCHEIKKSFGEKEVLKNITFHINEHEKVALIGNNGAGKTTLFHIIQKELSPDDGVISIKKDATVGYVAQVQNYNDDHTIMEELLSAKQDVIDMEDSPAFKDGSVESFRTDDTELILEKNNEPAMSGSLKTACSVSDALTLQYYEEADPVKAAFGSELTEEQWTEIADVKDVYNDVLFTAPLIAYNVANPLLKEIYSEMNVKDREFTFLCGHDSNIGSVLAALDCAEYDLPGSIEKKAPIGVKLVFSKWKAGSGEVFWDVDLVYQTTQQLRNVDILTEKDHPASVDIELNGLSQNQDSLYADKDLKGRLQNAIKEYDKLKDY